MRPLAFFLALGAAVAPVCAQSGADKVEALVQRLKSGFPGVGSMDVTLTEAEVNDYLASRLSSKVKEVRRASARFKDGHVADVEATVGLPPGALDRLPGDTPGIVRRTLDKLLKSENTVRVEAMFTSAKGKGFVQVRRVELNGIPVPQAFVRELMEFAGAKAKPPVDLNRLFELRYGLEKAEILPGALRVVLRPN